MDAIRQMIQEGIRNWIFLGEAGSGKSEIAMNWAIRLAQMSDMEVHFFDLDMTKPLFRSRDHVEVLRKNNVIVHYEEQFFDAPTQVGGVRELLQRRDCLTVLDVGGDHIGARAIGGYMQTVIGTYTRVFYVLNPYRPWSDSIEHIDHTLGQILGVSHIDVNDVHMIANPNFGAKTSAEDVIRGVERIEALISEYKTIDFACVMEDLQDAVKKDTEHEYFTIRRYLEYPWTN